jgi:ligand-binding SRPBCC domain-containing protein
MHFSRETTFPVSAAVLWAFHERPDAFRLLWPPWREVEVIQGPTSLEVGTRVVARTKVGPVWRTMVSEHVAYERGRMFADRMLKGPFSYWLHRHIVTAKGPTASMLTDDIEYDLPLGVVGAFVAGRFVRKELERLFTYRHDVTREACVEAAAKD